MLLELLSICICAKLTPTIVQLSSVCSKMAEAARQVVQSHSSVNFRPYHSGYQGPSLDRPDSRLMLSWAHFAKRLYLQNGSFAIEGIVRYAAAAIQVVDLILSCDDSLEAAQADDVLSCFRSVEFMGLRGFCIPSVFPATVTHLLFHGSSRYAGRSLDAAAADAVI